MAEISLRAYLDYIEDRLARDAYSEVAAQCRHILESYPKYTAVYRLLARALAAQEEYQDALDLFQRVLSADPSDFVAHIGMAEAYRESNALSQAIWHLERAFEQVPNNIELQEEIKSLYEQMGEAAPRRLHLTGGALARMYSKGDLYEQAISELTKAIVEDSERLDLQTLLADVLYRNRQIVDAGQMAGQVLKRLPYSTQANRILSQIWLDAGQPTEAHPFLQRVKEIDPYLAYQIENRTEAPAGTFQLPMLEYSAERHAEQIGAADWVSRIGSVEKKKGVTGPLPGLPEKKRSISEIFGTDAPPEPRPRDAAPADDEPPDWLRDVIKSTDELNETASKPATRDLGGPSQQSAPGVMDDAPDWLRDALGDDEAPAADASPEWLDDAISGPADTMPVAPVDQDTPDWLADVLEDQGVEETPPPAEPTPQTPSEPPVFSAVTDDDVPDWLGEVLDDHADHAEAPAEDTSSELAPVAETRIFDDDEDETERDVPNWLTDILDEDTEQPSIGTAELEATSGPETVSDEWLESFLEDDIEVLGAAAATAIAQVEDTPADDDTVESDSGDLPPWEMPDVAVAYEAPAADEDDDDGDIPDWLSDASAESVDATATEDDDAVPDWLATSADVDTDDDSDEDEAIPDWLATSSADEDSEDEDDDEEIPDWLKSDDADDQADTEAILDEPEDSDDIPDWLAEDDDDTEIPDPLMIEADTIDSMTPALEEEVQVAPPTDEPMGNDDGQDDIPDWLADGDLDSDDAIAWLEEIAAKYDPDFAASMESGEATAEGETEAVADPEPVAEAETESEDDDLSWLRDPLDEVAEDAEEAAEAEAEEMPEWLREASAEAGVIVEETETEAEPAAVAEADTATEADDAELPDWLADMSPADEEEAEPVVAEAEATVEVVTETTETVAETVAADEADDADLPDWLAGMEPADEEDEAEAVAEAEVTVTTEVETTETEETTGEAEAMAWLDGEVAAQGVDPDEAVEPALTRDQPPTDAPPAPPADEPARPATEDDLPSWLLDEDAQAAEAAAVEDDGLDIPDIEVEVEDEELAWLDNALATESSADDELADIFDEIPSPAPAATGDDDEELPSWLVDDEEVVLPPTPEPAADPTPVAAVEVGDDDELPGWLAGLGEGDDASVSEPVAEVTLEPEPEPEPVTVDDSGGVPAWLTADDEETDSGLEAFLQAVKPATGALTGGLNQPAPPAPPEPTPVAEVVPEPEPEPEPEPVAVVEPAPAAPATAPAEAASERLARARDQLAGGQTDESLDTYEQMVADNQDLSEVVRDLHEYIDRRMAKPRAYRIMGDALMAQNQVNEALDYYRRALDQF